MNYAMIDVVEAVGIRFNISVKELRCKGSTRRVSRPRQIAMYLSRRHTKASYPTLGMFYGGRDHTTILHGDRVIARMLTEDVDIVEGVASCRAIMEQRGSRVEALKQLGLRNPVLVTKVVAIVDPAMAGSWA